MVMVGDNPVYLSDEHFSLGVSNLCLNGCLK